MYQLITIYLFLFISTLFLHYVPLFIIFAIIVNFQNFQISAALCEGILYKFQMEDFLLVNNVKQIQYLASDNFFSCLETLLLGMNQNLK